MQDPELDLASIRAELNAILRDHGLTEDALHLVPSVQEWALANGRTEPNPFRQATAFPGSGHIVMLSRLNEAHARASNSFASVGIDEREWLAADLSRYAKFLLLHEIAHLKGMAENDADAWALAQIRRLEGT